ncbi:MAG: permease prefix domain 1-containing protein, partial [Defluviitaleaceae bacterium]|nr:permease prefix domain 1-containing protein [Defluviitaleaceae bacterium]
MEAIKTYIDNVFSAYPQNVRVMKLKNEMLASMEEKYHELKSQGKSENEAIGSVIANFGNMDEIIGELGIEAASTSENTISLTAEEVGEYMTQSRKSS